MFSVHGFATTTAFSVTTLTNIAPISDPVLAISGNYAYVPSLNFLLGVYGMGTGLTRMQLTTPSLQALVPFDVTPIDAAADPSSPLPVLIDPKNPLALVVNEPIQILETGTGTSNVYGIVVLGDGPQTPVTGAIQHVRGTIATTGTAGGWYNGAITLTNQLAEGTYNLVGCRVEGVHVVAARFVFPGQNNSVRPGLICAGGVGKFDALNLFRNGNMGVWGTFSSRVLPTVDTLTDGTGETATIILDVIKTG
jgi:hypothetical protein